MALETSHSYTAYTLQASMRAGKYAKLRWFRFEGMAGDKADGPDGRSDSTYPLWVRHLGQTAFELPCNDTYCVGSAKRTWLNASFGASYPNMKGHPGGGPFFSFSAACMEFGRNLLDELGDDAPPIGLIQSALGGSTIEAWSPNETVLACQNRTPGGPTAGHPTGHLFYGMVCPFVNMTVAGWAWYQGENNMHGDPGSSLLSGGYGCMMERMVAAWRHLWSAVPNTTKPLSPFGVVTIAPSGTEGADYHLSAFRWAQTANYGVLPNPVMPNTFVAQAYDLNDPWAGVNGDPFAKPSVCSDNASIPYSCTWTNNGTMSPLPCCQCGPEMASPRCVWDPSQWNRALAPLAPLVRNSTAVPQFMGSLHPRLKFPVGRRLALGLVATAYGGNNTVTGPTVSGCTFNPSSHLISVHFNKTLLKDDAVAITRTQTPIPPLPPNSSKPTRPGPVLDSSLMHVCTGNASDCSCLSWLKQGGQWLCEIPFDGQVPRLIQPVRGDIWTEVPIKLVDEATISIDTSTLNVTSGGVQAVKFGWSFGAGTCCVDLASNTGLAPCIPGSCGVMTRDSLLPLNPFFAIVANGQCRCPAPQICDETNSQ